MKKLFTAIIGCIMCCTLLFASCGETPEGGGDTGPAPTAIGVSGMKTSFTFGESFSALGLTVEITYADDTTRTAISREYTVDSSAYDATAVGEYPIIVKLNNTELTKSYTVTVSKTTGEIGGGGEEKPIENVPLDLWILAGQSNAAGYSQLSQKVTGQNYNYREYLYSQDERVATGYDVKYYGTADVRANAQMPQLGIQEKVGLGYGKSPDFIGPELGMAKGFADGNTGRQSAIVKYACGGTWLGDVAGEAYTTNTEYGGWASPSIVAQSGVTPHEYASLMYTRLLATVENAINAFTAKGYVVSVKGFVWMQGEADAGQYSASEPDKWAAVYEKNLKLFIADLRNDVAEIAKDEAVKTRPFIIGKINDTGTYGRDEEEATVRAAQDSVAAADDTVFAVESNDLLIYDGGNCVGSDSWHFNAGDMFTLGQRFAKAALDALK